MTKVAKSIKLRKVRYFLTDELHTRYSRGLPYLLPSLSAETGDDEQSAANPLHSSAESCRPMQAPHSGAQLWFIDRPSKH